MLRRSGTRNVLGFHGVGYLSETRSKVFHAEVEGPLSKSLEGRGLRLDRALLSVVTDLNLAGEYERVHLLIFDDRLVTAAAPGEAGGDPVRLDLSRESVRQVRNRQGIGGGFLEALVDGMFLEVLAYSNARADVFHKVATKLTDWCEGRPVVISPQDDEDPRKCPKCGMTLEFKGEICRRCVDRGAVISRVARLMRPYASWAVLMFVVLLAVIGLRMVPPWLTKFLVDKVVAPEASAAAPLATRITWLVYLVMALLAVDVLVAAGTSVG